MTRMMNRLLEAMNAHDLDAFVACFAEDYRSQQPTKPSRAFVGRTKVRENWTNLFSAVPDFTAELLVAAQTDDGVEIGEWSWSGTYTDGSPFAVRGSIVVGLDDERIAWGRLYMDTVTLDGGDPDEVVRDADRPPTTG